LRKVLSSRRIAGGGRESEVEYFHRTTDRDLDVRRLQVAMDNPLLMSGLERFRDLRAIESASTTGNPDGWATIRSASVSPSTSSITIARVP
jgi:hypothetical protein